MRVECSSTAHMCSGMMRKRGAGGLSAQTQAHRANIRFKKKKERKKNPFCIQRGFDEQCATKVLAFPLRKSLSKASLGGGGGLAPYWTTPSACGLGCMRRLLALAGGAGGWGGGGMDAVRCEHEHWHWYSLETLLEYSETKG